MVRKYCKYKINLGNEMNPEIRITLLKELENIKRVSSRNSYPGAWMGLIVSVLWIAQIVYIMSKPAGSSATLNGLMMVLAIALLLQSFYVITRHIADRRMVLLLEALLESKISTSGSGQT
ncbi:MAG: hypothetical protein HF311_16945 [Ignavibacteria bacterium]|nr:hypothetical protein [Ignavibacteria bacterium]